MLEFDDLLARIGSFGRYQLLFCVVLSLGTVNVGMTGMLIVFLGATPEHHCAVPAIATANLSRRQRLNLSVPYDTASGAYSSCTMYDRNYSGVTEDFLLTPMMEEKIIPCQNGWEYDKSVYESTIVTEWDMVCENNWMWAATTSLYMIGSMLGSSCFGWFADRFGRKMCLRVAALPLVAATLGACFSPNLLTFNILRMVTSMCNSPFYMVAGIIVSEIVPVRQRTLAVTLVLAPWVLGFMLTAGVAYLIRDRFTLQFAMAVPSVLMLAYMFVLDESPRWLYVKGRVDEAERLTRKIARMNKVEYPESEKVFVRQSRQSTNGLDLIRTPNVRRRTMLLSFIWSVAQLGYYVLAFNTAALAGNEFLNAFLGVVIELPCYLLSPVTMKWAGRRWANTAYMTGAGLLLLATTPIQPDSSVGYLGTALTMISRLSLSVSVMIMTVYTMELFPTEIRNLGSGMCTFVSKIGSILAPYFVQLKHSPESCYSQAKLRHILNGKACVNCFFEICRQ